MKSTISTEKSFRAMRFIGIHPRLIENQPKIGQTGRWQGIPRSERICQFCCNGIGDTKHFFHECRGITAELVESLGRKDPYAEARGRELFFWRGVARRVEFRWRERTSALRMQRDEPAHSAEANGAEICADADILGRTRSPEQWSTGMHT